MLLFSQTDLLARRQRIKPLKLRGMKRQPSQVRGMDRVNEILDACETLLGETRYEEISTDDIIKAANVTRGTLYHFFENRRAVFIALMHRALLEIDEQTIPRPGEDQLEFADYVSKVERRLQNVWRKHSHIVEFYESNKYSPDFDEPRREERMGSVAVMVQQLLTRHPDISPARARNISSTLLHAIYTGLDTSVLSQTRGGAGFKREWRLMITAYIASLELPKGK
jgi:AcrR family transcriptional regulator